ncbi:MAG: hypothetical protein QOJ57_2377 [Thermoleophilaceae bacterium]|jgi:hypothetical protein|nr:hypothetical protein [Thermoleophilaceae bacterium]
MPRRLVALCCAVAAVSGCGGGGSTGQPAARESGPSATPLDPARTATLADPDFDTAVPSDWHRRQSRKRGQRFYYLNSGPGFASDYGIASRGEVGLTIATQPSSDLPDGISARAAYERIVATPDEATGTARKPVRAARLDGAQAAMGQSTYRFKGRSMIQTNMVAIGRGVIVFIEVDAEPEDAAEGQRVLSTVVDSWRWSERAAVVPS